MEIIQNFLNWVKCTKADDPYNESISFIGMTNGS